jgi:uncharacterized NAD(P)/FAD-binding protein YdhS
MTEIGIIGAGAATVALLDSLTRTGARPGGITVFDGAPTLWRGRPYQPDLDAVRVNVPPARMSIRATDTTHHARWLAARQDTARFQDERLGQPLPPRWVYGEYLADTALTAIDALRAAGWRVDVVNAHVTGYAGNELHTEVGDRVRVDRAVLAVGGGSPHDHYGLSGTAGFVREPYPLANTLTEVPPDAHVAVIGSGLTAVDVVAALAARGHRGPISLLSRSGMLPFVQQRPTELSLRRLTVDRLAPGLTFEKLVEWMRAELGADYDDFAAELATAPTADWLRDQLAAVDSPNLGRRTLLLAIRTVGPAAWPLLPERERKWLRDNHFRLINNLSSPMVPHNAAILSGLLDSGQVRLAPGVRKIEATTRGFTVDTGWDADAVVNAVNPPPYAIPAEAAGLVSTLLAEGVVEPGTLGGLRAVPAGGWHVLGNLAADSMPIATSPPGLAMEAERLARTLAD